MSNIIMHKNKYRSYSITPVYSRIGGTCRLLFFTASKNKNLNEWELGLQKLNKPHVFHNTLEFEKKESEKFWNDWERVWSAPGTPGQSTYHLFRNKYDKNSFLYHIYDTEIYGYHTYPGRYNEWFEFKSPNEQIKWFKGTKNNYKERKAYIRDLINIKE